MTLHTGRTSAPTVYAGTPRVAAMRAELARCLALLDAYDDMAADTIEYDDGADPAAVRRLDWYVDRSRDLARHIERVKHAIRCECAATGEAVMPR